MDLQSIGQEGGDEQCCHQEISGGYSGEGGGGKEDEDRRLVMLVVCGTIIVCLFSVYSLDLHRKYKFSFIKCTVLTAFMFYVLV